jgi:hypothetical protein
MHPKFLAAPVAVALTMAWASVSIEAGQAPAAAAQAAETAKAGDKGTARSKVAAKAPQTWTPPTPSDPDLQAVERRHQCRRNGQARRRTPHR